MILDGGEHLKMLFLSRRVGRRAGAARESEWCATFCLAVNVRWTPLFRPMLLWKLINPSFLFPIANQEFIHFITPQGMNKQFGRSALHLDVSLVLCGGPFSYKTFTKLTMSSEDSLESIHVTPQEINKPYPLDARYWGPFGRSRVLPLSWIWIESRLIRQSHWVVYYNKLVKTVVWIPFSSTRAEFNPGFLPFWNGSMVSSIWIRWPEVSLNLT